MLLKRGLPSQANSIAPALEHSTSKLVHQKGKQRRINAVSNVPIQSTEKLTANEKEKLPSNTKLTANKEAKHPNDTKFIVINS